MTVSASDSKYRATAEMTWDITHTDIAIKFNFKEKTANATATLSMHPYFYNSDKIVLDAKSMDIHSVKVNGNLSKINYNNDSLTINLDRQYHRTEDIEVVVSYTAKPYATNTNGGDAIRDDRGLYFINTDEAVEGKPMQIWTQGETEANSHWVPTFDKPNERFTATLHITVPNDYTTLSNGELTHSSASEDGMRTDTWEMKQEVQPYVLMMAIGKYSIVSDKSWNGKEIKYYVEPEYEPSASEIFKHTPEMVEFFSNVTGVPYPWNKYSQVVVRDFVSGAMENTTASLFGEFVNLTKRELLDDDNEDVVAHELFHQWFGDYTTAESWSNITVNESFANYGEQLWRRYKYGRASEEQLAYKDLNAYLNQTRQNDAPLVRFHYNSKDDVFDRISYQKGGAILRYIHGQIGDSAFYKAMNIYLTDNALQPAEAHHWRLALEKATGKDWNPFFNQWYFNEGHPALDIKYKYDDAAKNVVVTITQKQNELYKLSFMIDVIAANQTKSEQVFIEQKTTKLTYPYTNNKKPVLVIDAQHWLVGRIADNKTPEEWLAMYKLLNPDAYISKFKVIEANADKINTTTVQNLFKLIIQDNLEYIRASALYTLAQVENKSVQDIFTTEVMNIAKQDKSNHVRAAANAVLAAWEVKAAEQQLYSSLTDTSYRVAANALVALRNITNKDTVYTISKNILSNKPEGDLIEQVWYYIGEYGSTSDTTWVKNTSKYVNASGKHKIPFAMSMSAYMKEAKSNRAFTIALNATEKIAITENIGVYRAAIASYIYEVAYYYKEKKSKEKKNSRMGQTYTRLDLLRQAMLNIEAAETDKENIAKFKQYKKAIYGN